MEKIFHKKNLLAIKFKVSKKGSNPLTPEEASLQVIALRHPKEHVIKSHLHKPVRRTTNQLAECLVIIRGKIKVDVYSPDRKFLKSFILRPGDGALLLSGGHGVRFLEKSELIEIKSGPFIDDKIFI